MNNEIKEHDLTFGDAIILPNNEENWKFILADRTYTLDAPTEVIVSRMLEQLLAEQAKNKKLVEALDEISGCTQHKSDFCNHQSDCSFCRMGQAQQALNEVNK